MKGTAEILDALEHLRREGLRFELRLLENTPNDEVLRILTDADIVVDELNEAHYGMLALEAMATGCVVLAGNRPDIVPIPSDRPVIHVHPGNLVEAFRAAIVDRAERVERAHSGRPFVAHHHAENGGRRDPS